MSWPESVDLRQTFAKMFAQFGGSVGVLRNCFDCSFGRDFLLDLCELLINTNSMSAV